MFSKKEVLTFMKQIKTSFLATLLSGSFVFFFLGITLLLSSCTEESADETTGEKPICYLTALYSLPEQGEELLNILEYEELLAPDKQALYEYLVSKGKLADTQENYQDIMGTHFDFLLPYYEEIDLQPSNYNFIENNNPCVKVRYYHKIKYNSKPPAAEYDDKYRFVTNEIIHTNKYFHSKNVCDAIVTNHSEMVKMIKGWEEEGYIWIDEVAKSLPIPSWTLGRWEIKEISHYDGEAMSYQEVDPSKVKLVVDILPDEDGFIYEIHDGNHGMAKVDRWEAENSWRTTFGEHQFYSKQRLVPYRWTYYSWTDSVDITFKLDDEWYGKTNRYEGPIEEKVISSLFTDRVMIDILMDGIWSENEDHMSLNFYIHQTKFEPFIATSPCTANS